MTFIFFLVAIVACAISAHADERLFRKMLVVGDSITHHGPEPTLGWEGNWGMAASRQSADYVHLFRDRLAAHQEGVSPELLICAEGGGTLVGKQAHLPKYADFAPDLAIVQMGENDNKDVSEDGFQKPYENILRAVRQSNETATILCLGVWSPPTGSPAKDDMIRQAAKKFGARFVDMQEANANAFNSAASENRYSDKGVAWHPGDAGMNAYSAAMWATLRDPASADRTAVRASPPSKKIVFQEVWKSGSGWQPTVSPSQGTLEVASKNGESLLFEKPLPAEQLRGRQIFLKCRIKGREISVRPESWNGVKFLLKLRNAEGKNDYPQAELPVGTFDWKDVSWSLRVPDNIVEASLVLGLEGVSGTAWFGAAEIGVSP